MAFTLTSPANVERIPEGAVEHIGLRRGARREEVEVAIEGHVLGQAQLMGRYERYQ
jgi:phosphatidylethanolamine-binding protein (PEBP) family uncharacterized protein